MEMGLLLKEFICFDVETTGLSPYKDSIIEIGAVRFNVEEGIKDSFSSLVFFDGTIRELIVNITGISNELVKTAPPLDIVIKDFIKFIDKYPMLAHNASFDRKFISMALQKLNHPYPQNPIYDTIAIFKKLIPNLKSYKLQSLKQELNIHSLREHRGFDDAKATSSIFSFALNKNKSNGALKKGIGALTKAIYFEG